MVSVLAVAIEEVRRCLKPRLHVALKPVSKPLSIEPVWELLRAQTRVNALNRFSNRLRNPLPWGGLKLVSMRFRR